MFCNSCGAEVDDWRRICPACGAETVKVEERVVTQEVLGTKWADFLGYFWLWISALFSVIGMVQLGELMSEDSAFFSTYPGMKGLIGVCIVLGIGSIALAITAAVAIINRKRMAGKLVCAISAYNCIYDIIFVIGFHPVIGSSYTTSNTGFRCALEVIMFFVNAYYFSNREDIFVN